MQQLTKGSAALNFLWVVDFPLLTFSQEEQRWHAVHHPFTRPKTEDIPMLARHFTQRFARRMGRRIETIPDATLEALGRYPWPGNIREMQNVIERAVILSRGQELEIPLSQFKQRPKAAAADF